MQRTVKTTARERFVTTVRENDLLVGAMAVTLAIAILATMAVIYLKPFGQKTISFQTTDASAITTGLDVRVAGIRVGQVSNISIGKDAVTVHAQIDESTFVGDQSTIEVRMLTPVGGYAVSLIPAGDQPAPDGVIAPERVRVPYSIADVLQSVPTVTDEIDSTTVNANLQQLATALQGNPASLQSIVDGADAVTKVLASQRQQIHDIAALASEYLQNFNTNRQFVFELITKIDTVITTYNFSSAGFNDAYRLLGSALWRIQPLEKYYLDNSDVLLDHIRSLQTLVGELSSNFVPVLDNLMGLRDQLTAWMTPAGMAEAGTDSQWLASVCVPVPGKGC
ncbi:MlaD family protein [Rhodococcus erythropolis]|uniref:MlaD family protein n=1 Tax=Rhodococcus erythropolis TaxID=1833 RepID=UPI00294B2F0B|nr:MlaD family protein [Rhodococcus erythropolis]